MKSIILIIITVLSFTTFGQNKLERRLGNIYRDSELVTIAPTLTYDQAMQMLSKVSELSSGKKIISTVSINSPVGIELNSVSYQMALDIIVNLMDLMYEEDENSIIIKRKVQSQEDDKFDESIYADVTDKEIRISAIFFEADVENSLKVGMDWKWLIGKSGLSIGTELRSQSKQTEGSTTQQVLPPEFNITSEYEFTLGDFDGNAMGMLQFFETENLGEIIASPSVTVRNKQPGRVQVGEDFSIKQRDFSGNIIDKFYSAGSIIEVSPYVYQKNDRDYILLKLNVEKSSFFPSELTTVIKKTSSKTDVLLLDGQQTVIGGLYQNEENKVRQGIPFLKDLPWWVFGIRYLAGYDETVIRKKENIIVIKAEILPTIEERMNALIEDENVFQEQVERNKEIPKKYTKKILNN